MYPREEDELFELPLPDSLNDDDAKWIRKQLKNMPKQTHIALCKGYADIHAGFFTDPNIDDIKRANVARKNANQWLLSKVNRYRNLRQVAKDNGTKSPF